MIALAFFCLSFCLKAQVITVESFLVPSVLPTTIICSSSATSAKRNLKQASDDSVSEGIESFSSLNNEEINLDWIAIADYVFDESVSSTEISEPNQSQGQNEGIDDDQLVKNLKPHHHSKPIILFDGICNLCNGGVNFAIDRDKSGKFRFASLQSNVAKSLLLRDGKDPSSTSDIVLVTPEKTYYSSEAVARIMAGLDMPALKFLGIMGQISPSFARNTVYQIVSGNRFMFGENDSCRMDFDGEYTSRFVSDPPESISWDSKKEDKEDK